MNAKSIFLSKTFWFNLLALVVLVAKPFGFGDFQADPDLESYALVIVTLVNIVLRLLTKETVKLK
jgi:hypothetical protein